MASKWIAMLRIVVGVFFLAQGMNKMEWLESSEPLKTNLERYAQNAPAATRWYQDHVARPGAEAWARLIPIGEVLIGVSLILGILAKTTLIIATALVVNFHITNGKLFSSSFFSDPYAMLLLACLVALYFLKAGGVFALGKSVRRAKTKRKPGQ